MKTFCRLLVLIGYLALDAKAAEAEAREASQPDSFRVVDIFVDSGDRPLAAYQLEFTATQGAIRIAGIEGGEPAAFREPPHYDPRAIQGERVILAAFSTERSERLPQGRTRVASIHLQVLGELTPEYRVELKTAATEDTQRIAVKVSAEPRKTE